MKVELDETVSTKDWVITILITALPVIGLVMLFIWAFGGDTATSKANWAKGKLIWIAVTLISTLFIISVFGTALIALMKDLPNF